MTPSAARSLPPLAGSPHIPANSAVRVLTRNLENASSGDARNAAELLETATALKAAGYLRTAMTYFALGIRREQDLCLIEEQDGLALETHDILRHFGGRARDEKIMVAHNPETTASFWLKHEKPDVRALYIELGGSPGGLTAFPVYREVSTPKSSGVLLAVANRFDLSGDLLIGEWQTQRPTLFRPLHQQPQRGQLELFAGGPAR